jgi:hypothetical protein
MTVIISVFPIAVPSPDTHSNKSTPSPFLLTGRLQTPPISSGDAATRGIPSGATTSTLGSGVGGVFGRGGGGGGGGSQGASEVVGNPGQDLVAAMSSAFNVPSGSQSEVSQNATVKQVSTTVCADSGIIIYMAGLPKTVMQV